MRRLLPTLAALWLSPALAQEFIETRGPLDDEAFYRLVSCGAPPGEACTKPAVYWQVDRPLRVTLTQVDRAFLGGKQKRARAALTRAIQHLNAADTGISLQEVPPQDAADIHIHLIDTDGTTPITGTGIKGIDSTILKGARVLVWANRDTTTISRARILFGTRLNIRHYESAMIEELTQALGLLTDIRNPAYDGISVFSQDSNDAKTLGPQDVMALRRHYPPKE